MIRLKKCNELLKKNKNNRLAPLSKKLVEQISFFQVRINDCEKKYDKLCALYVESPKTMASDKLF